VSGQMRIRESERDGRQYVSAELLASGIGHDLSRGTSAFVRVATARAGPSGVPGPNWETLPGSSEVLHGATAEAGVPGQAIAP
jgi:single-strand DNA-binding protein